MTTLPAVYRQPIAPMSAHPGLTINNGWGWIWTGRYRSDGRVGKFWARTSYGSKGELKDAMERYMTNVEFVDGAPADKDPTVVFPVPPHAFQFGIIDRMIREERGDVRPRSIHRTLIARVPLLTRR